MQGNPSTGHQGDIGETLICFEILLNHFEDAKIKWARNKEHKFLASAINYAWVVLEKYYKLLDETPVYAAAVILNPIQKWPRLHKAWSSRKQWITTYEKRLANVWMKEYKGKSPVPSRPHSRENEDTLDIFDQYLRASDNDNVKVAGQEDEYVSYC